MPKTKLKIQKHNRYVHINIARMRDGTWVPCWYPKWFGAKYKHKAVALRREWWEYLKTANSSWKRHHLKTIKVKLPEYA